jgi:hypothetical protein
LHLNHLLSQAPALFFHFSWTDSAPCLSKNGRGKVFLRGTIFQRSLVDLYSRDGFVLIMIPESGNDLSVLHAFIEKEFDDATLLNFHHFDTFQLL